MNRLSPFADAFSSSRRIRSPAIIDASEVPRAAAMETSSVAFRTGVTARRIVRRCPAVSVASSVSVVDISRALLARHQAAGRLREDVLRRRLVLPELGVYDLERADVHELADRRVSGDRVEHADVMGEEAA